MSFKEADLDELTTYGIPPGGIEGWLRDGDALDILNHMLSAEEWSVSMLEDAAEILRASGRNMDIDGAEWPSH